MPQRRVQVLHGLLGSSLCVKLHHRRLAPAAVILAVGDRLKRILRPLPAFIGEKPAHGFIGSRLLAHCLVAGQSASRGSLLRVVILIAIEMQPHQIKSVDQLPTRRIGRVVRVEEFAAIVQNRAACRTAACERISVRGVVYGLIDTGNEFVHRRGDIVDPAERAHDAAFLRRIALLCRKLLRGLRTEDHRPLGHVAPVGIGRQHRVRVKHGLVGGVVDILAIFADAAEVHQARGFKCRRVCVLKPDILRRPASQRLIFVRRAGPVQRKQHAQPRRGRMMLARRVDAVAAAQRFHASRHSLRLPGRDIVEVERKHVTPRHCARLAACSDQSARHIAADVLQLVLLRLRKTQVLRHCLRAARGDAQLLIQFRQQQRLRLPESRFSGGTDRNCNLSVVLHDFYPLFFQYSQISPYVR